MLQTIKNYTKKFYKRKSKLRHLIITLTYQCQLKCKMCGQVNTPEDAPNSRDNWTQIPLDVITSRINEMEILPETMYLFGGEPLIYKDIFKLSKFLNEKKIKFSYSTNGLLLKKYTDNILENPPNMISVSMDGYTSELHDEIRGLKGSWTKAMEGMKNIVEKRGDSKFPEIKIHFTITPENYNTMEEYYNFFINEIPQIDEIKFHMPRFATEKMGIEYVNAMQENFKVNCLSYLGNFSDEVFVNDCKTKIDTDELHKQITNLLKKPKVAYLGPTDKDEIELFFQKPEYYPKDKRVCICKHSIAIQPNGDFANCGDYPDLSFGNIRDTKISDAFESVTAKKWREYLNKNGNPGVLSKCSRLYRTVYSKN